MLKTKRKKDFSPITIREQITLPLASSGTGNAALKRTFDILLSFIFLITIFPFIYLIVGLIIKIESHGPVLFIQEREGKNGRRFHCYKFRSMRKNGDLKQACRNDPRITRIGQFIRKTNVDELPQFINVLKGDMSIVGPRPHPVWLNEKFSFIIPQYDERHSVKPGITGWAQICGFRGETRTLEQMEGRIAKDLWYIENWTLTLDLTIIWRTLLIMFRGDGKAY